MSLALDVLNIEVYSRYSSVNVKKAVEYMDLTCKQKKGLSWT